MFKTRVAKFLFTRLGRLGLSSYPLPSVSHERKKIPKLLNRCAYITRVCFSEWEKIVEMRIKFDFKLENKFYNSCLCEKTFSSHE